MLASYVLDPGRRGHGLDDLALEILDHRTIRYGELFAPGDRRRDILAVPLPRIARYAAEDADVTLRLHERLAERLAAEELDELFHELEMPLSAVLLRMERAGIKLDVAFLDELRGRFAAVLADLEQKIAEAAGGPFNVQSPKQLQEILFDRLGLKPVKKTATGWSTDASVLEQLADAHPLPGLILEYREVAKLQSTYVETLPGLAEPETGLIHTSYNQAVAATGRLSSSEPNLQNIPVRTELGRLIRRAFVPRVRENVFLSADYSQVELRLLAHLSGDAALRQAFRDGVDVHRRTAALIAGVAEAEVTPEMRNRAKAINFGVIYGMGARSLARQISVSLRDARAFIETYFATYPDVRAFIESTKQQARERGCVETMLGRRRLLPDITSTNDRLRAFQERIAVNTPIQGTAADLIKRAMIRIDRELRERAARSRMLLQVHDELVFEVPRAELAETSQLVRDTMETALELTVPLVVDLHTGANWAEAHG
jgi:DNA polymerase-1